MLVSILVAKVFWTCRDRIADPDIWWHLKNAQYLMTTGHFPKVDMLSFTAAGSPWVSYEWLSECFYYMAYQAWGLKGIFLLFTVVVSVMVVTVFRLALRNSGEPMAAAVATIAGGVMAMVGFSPRTQLFGWLCFLGIFVILLRFRERRAAPLWLIPVLFCIWVNCHGSWPIGIAVYGLIVVCGLIRHDVGHLEAASWSPAELRRLLLTGAASLVALGITPFGYRLAIYPFELLSHQHVMMANVEEWASIDFNDSRGKIMAVILGGIAYLAFAGRKRWRMDEAALTAFVLYCGATHMRLLLLTGIVLPPLLAGQIGRFSSYDPRQERRLLNSAFVLAAALFVYFGFPTDAKQRDQIAAFFPVDSVEFLRTHPQPGRIFNTFEAGGYLEWHLPKVPTFIDSRSDVFEYKGVLQDYLAIAAVRNSQELLDHYNVNYVIDGKDTALAYFLTSNGRWQQIYEGSHSVVLRRVPR